MRLVLLLLVLFWIGKFHSQIDAVIKTGLGIVTEGLFTEFDLGTGIRLDKKLLIGANFRYSSTAWLDAETPAKFSVINFEAGYRFLQNEKKKSPLVSMELGVPISSNLNNSFIQGVYSISNVYSEGAWRYDRGLFYGKLSALYDLRLKDFNLQFGASYNLWMVEYTELIYSLGNSKGYYEGKRGTWNLHHFGLEAGLMYTIPTKREKNE